MEFRHRNYISDQESHKLHRTTADSDPLSSPASSHTQVNVVDHGNKEFFDPLRRTNGDPEVSGQDQNSETFSSLQPVREAVNQQATKEWTSLRRLLLQRFPVSKMVSISSVSDVITKSGKTFEKSSTSTHLEELEDPQKFAEEDVKVITRQEYVSRMHELKDEINRAWLNDDRVTSLKLSIKVAKLLMDTSVLEFYPTLFVLATDILDMLGEMVWQRIMQKAEFAEDGTLPCSLSENFEPSNVCSDAKETCNNWFCKIGAVRELLPRIYLELAILPCWRFLLEQPVYKFHRLVMMMRGLADPVASAYCRLYMAHCAQKLCSHDKGHLFTCINDIGVLLIQETSKSGSAHGNITNRKRMLVNLIEPTIEYFMKCIFKDLTQNQVSNVFVDLGLRKDKQSFGSIPCVSIVLHHLLKELPAEVVSSNAVEILHLTECSNDCTFDQHMNYRLLGIRLYEIGCPLDTVNAVVDKVMQVIDRYESLDECLKVVDAYVDLVLQNQMGNYLSAILEGISGRGLSEGITEDELASLQSILVKLLSHYKHLQDIFAEKYFTKILNMMWGNSRSIVNMHILNMATRSGYIRDSTTIEFLFEISQALHDNEDIVNLKDANGQAARLISHFVIMVDYGEDIERHLAFLVDCRAAFGGIDGLKETLVHSSNCLAIKSLKGTRKHLNFVKSCITCSEVTILSVFSQSRQLNLYLETAEVALFGGLLSHCDELLDSAICCLQSLNLIDGSHTPADVDGIVSAIRKLCGLLVMVPGNSGLGINYFPNSILSSVNSLSWMTPRMRSQIFCGIILLLTTISQNRLPYHADSTEIMGNDQLYYGDSSYMQELISFSYSVLQKLVDVIEQEPSQVARGIMALEACNCIALSFKPSDKISPVCLSLIKTAKSCLSARDKYLQSTIKFLGTQLPAFTGMAVPSVFI